MRPGFTLVELLVVIGIIAILMSILLPTLGRVRQHAQKIKCGSNLRQVGLAMIGYANGTKNFLPYPTTTLGERSLWYNAVDAYLTGIGGSANRTGVAAERNYTAMKQCVVYDEFSQYGGVQIAGAQEAIVEYARSYKMNSHLRRNNPATHCRTTDIREPSATVLMGDALSLDMVPARASQFENGQFSMEVNDRTQATPALRHLDGANILFVDGHVEWLKLDSVTKTLRSPDTSVTVKTWESEFINAGGTPTDLPDKTRTFAAQGLQRNPRMPLIWSQPPFLYRP